jgi:hypothetical protein
MPGILRTVQSRERAEEELRAAQAKRQLLSKAKDLAIENDIDVDFESCPCDHCVESLVATIVACDGKKQRLFETLYHAPHNFFPNCSGELTGSVVCGDYCYYVTKHGSVERISASGKDKENKHYIFY